jgi:glycosyltransferase involved in cell wall biosynthesis
VDARVRFLGYRKDVALILAASDVFALPSLWEGMSNAVLEAMAAGKPVVATAVDGAVDQVLPGESGLLVPPGDADALAQALLDLARDPRKAQEMGIKGRERVRREFSLDRMTDAYIELYRRLLEK